MLPVAEIVTENIKTNAEIAIVDARDYGVGRIVVGKLLRVAEAASERARLVEGACSVDEKEGDAIGRRWRLSASVLPLFEGDVNASSGGDRLCIEHGASLVVDGPRETEVSIWGSVLRWHRAFRGDRAAQQRMPASGCDRLGGGTSEAGRTVRRELGDSGGTTKVFLHQGWAGGECIRSAGNERGCEQGECSKSGVLPRPPKPLCTDSGSHSLRLHASFPSGEGYLGQR